LNIDEGPNKKLVSYIVGNTSIENILEQVRKILPAYMIPAYIKIENSFPLNSNRKIDRKLIAAQIVSAHAIEARN